MTMRDPVPTSLTDEVSRHREASEALNQVAFEIGKYVHGLPEDTQVFVSDAEHDAKILLERLRYLEAQLEAWKNDPHALSGIANVGEVVAHDLSKILHPDETDKAVYRLIQVYATDAQKIYDQRTAGDHTWQGLLWTFLREIQPRVNELALQEARDQGCEEGRDKAHHDGYGKACRDITSRIKDWASRVEIKPTVEWTGLRVILRDYEDR